jgi:hypothetical protein
MNKTVSIWLLTLFFALLPAIGRAQGDCVTKFKAETDPLTEQFKELDKQSADLSKRRSAAKTREEQDALLQEWNALQEKRKSLREQVDEAAKRMARCMGAPTTKEEAQKMEADMKARISKQEQDWKTRAKPYENMPVGSSSNSQGSGNASSSSQGLGITTQGLVAMPPIQDPGSTPPTPSSSRLPSYGSGRTPEQRAAALAIRFAALVVHRISLEFTDRKDKQSNRRSL